MRKGFSQGMRLGRDTGLFSGGEDSLAEKVLVPGRSGTEGMENRVRMGKGQAGGQQSGHLLPDGPGEGRSELEKRCGFWAGPSHLFFSISSLLTGALPVYSCSKSGKDLFASQESIYSAFSFSNPVTLRFFSVCLASSSYNNKRNHPHSFSSPLPLSRPPPCPKPSWRRMEATAVTGGPGACYAKPLPCALARQLRAPHCPLQAI